MTRCIEQVSNFQLVFLRIATLANNIPLLSDEASITGIEA